MVNGRLTRVPLPPETANILSALLCIAEDASGENGRFRAVQSVDREWLRGISGIVETANGDLWLNGLGGIVHLPRKEITESLERADCHVVGERFGRPEGLSGASVSGSENAHRDRGTDGRLWFTVYNGVVSLDPARASNMVPAPTVTIQSVLADGRDHGLDPPIKLAPHTSSVQIGYSAVSLSNPEAIRFRHKLRETIRAGTKLGGPIS